MYSEKQRVTLLLHPALECHPEDVSDKRAGDTFITKLRCPEFIEEMGRLNPKKLSKLMDIVNKFADGEDTYHNKRTRSPKDDRSHRYRRQRCMPRNFENYGSHNQVAVGYRDSNDNSDDEHRRSGNCWGFGANKKIYYLQNPKLPKIYLSSNVVMINWRCRDIPS
jgi:hypothetical protein